MDVYLASPNSQLQAHSANGMPVLLSFASYKPWLDQYVPSFRRVLRDSGAFSDLAAIKAGKPRRVDLQAFRDWSEPHKEDAIAGLDDILGDWQLSLKNYQAIEWSFPTIHDSDPPELLPELVAMALERNRWLGIGLMPPREGKERFVRWVCANVPSAIHVHGWALRMYSHVARLDSVDSTNWWRDAMKLRQQLPWLTYGECLDLMVRKYQRWTRLIREPETVNSLFERPTT